jgi:hypothetical protein
MTPEQVEKRKELIKSWGAWGERVISLGLFFVFGAAILAFRSLGWLVIAYAILVSLLFSMAILRVCLNRKQKILSLSGSEVVLAHAELNNYLVK